MRVRYGHLEWKIRLNILGLDYSGRNEIIFRENRQPNVNIRRRIDIQEANLDGAKEGFEIGLRRLKE